MITLLIAMVAWAQDVDLPVGEPEPVEEAAASEEGPHTAITASLVVHVGEPVEVAHALIARARELGGWFQSHTGERVSLRIPVAHTEALLEHAATLGKVVDRSIQRQDVGQRIAELEGRLQAREEVLERYYEVLEEAGPTSVVAVERQIVDAIRQIEALKGQIRVLQDQAAHARFDVAFQYRDRRAPVGGNRTSFDWLGSLDARGLLRGLQEKRARWRTVGVGVPTPHAFSAWRNAGRYRAVSPDGVLYRVRTVKHFPKADLPFWKEAAREHLVAAGYKLISEEDIRIDGHPAALLELGAPMGEEDWGWMVAFTVKGNRIVIAEAAGEAVRLGKRKGDLITAMQNLSL